MEIFWNIFFWIAIIAITGIIASVVTNSVNKKAEAQKYIADAQNDGNYKTLVEEATETSTTLLTRLTEVEKRLASIEKTLTDIP